MRVGVGGEEGGVGTQAVRCWRETAPVYLDLALGRPTRSADTETSITYIAHIMIKKRLWFRKYVVHCRKFPSNRISNT